MKRPLISYINSCYNAEQFLDGLIENLLSQSEENIEIIIVDSKSTDNSLDIANSWQYRDERVKVIAQPERTPYGTSWLVGWEAAKGIIVANSNSDDRSYQWRTNQVYDSFMLRNITRVVKPPAFYYGGYETRVDGVPVARGIPPEFSVDDLSQFFRCGVHIHWENSIRNKCDWPKMFEASKQYKSAFDYWLVLYFISLGAVGVPIKNCFSIYNQRKDSLEQSDKERNTFESLRAIQQFFPSSKAIMALESDTKNSSPEFYQRYKTFCDQFNLTNT